MNKINDNIKPNYTNLKNDRVNMVVDVVQNSNLSQTNIKKSLKKLLNNIKYIEDNKMKIHDEIKQIRLKDKEKMKLTVQKLMNYIKKINESFEISPEKQKEYINNVINEMHGNKDFYNNLNYFLNDSNNMKKNNKNVKKNNSSWFNIK